MTTRRFFFGLVFASVILACFAGWLVARSTPHITRAPFERVKKDMPRQEVLRILGTPRKSVIVSDELYCDYFRTLSTQAQDWQARRRQAAITSHSPRNCRCWRLPPKR